MHPKKPESELVRLVVPDAPEAEIKEATRHRFGFLQTIDRIVTEREQAHCDSRDSDVDDRFEKCRAKV